MSRIEELSCENESLRKKVDGFISINSLLDKQSRQLEDKINCLEEENDDLTSDYITVEEEMHNLEFDLQCSKDENKDLMGKISALEEDLSEMAEMTESEGDNDLITHLFEENAELTADLEDCSLRCDKYNKDREFFQRCITRQKNSINILVEENEALKAKIKEMSDTGNKFAIFMNRW